MRPGCFWDFFAVVTVLLTGIAFLMLTLVG